MVASDARRTRLVVAAVFESAPLAPDPAAAAAALALEELPLREGASLPGPDRFLQDKFGRQQLGRARHRAIEDAPLLDDVCLEREWSNDSVQLVEQTAGLERGRGNRVSASQAKAFHQKRRNSRCIAGYRPDLAARAECWSCGSCCRWWERLRLPTCAQAEERPTLTLRACCPRSSNR